MIYPHVRLDNWPLNVMVQRGADVKLRKINNEQQQRQWITRKQAQQRNTWIDAASKAILDGLGTATVHRRCSSEHLVTDVLVLKCTLVDPRCMLLEWRDECKHKIPTETLEQAVNELKQEAIILECKSQ